MTPEDVDETLAWADPAIRKMYFQPDEEIDLGKADLITSKVVFPDLDVEDALVKLDHIAGQAGFWIDKINHDFNVDPADPKNTVKALNTFMYRDEKPDFLNLSYDLEDWADRKIDDERNLFIYGLMKAHKGSCSNLPIFYLVIAHRLGLPFSLVVTPDHGFLRYDDGKQRFNLETTTSEYKGDNGENVKEAGRILSDQEYIVGLNIPDRTIQSGAFMRSLSRKEALSEILLPAACILEKRKDYEAASKCCKLALLFDPRNIRAQNVLGHCSFRADNDMAAHVHLARAFELGMPFPDVKIGEDGVFECSREWLMWQWSSAMQASIPIPGYVQVAIQKELNAEWSIEPQVPSRPPKPWEAAALPPNFQGAPVPIPAGGVGRRPPGFQNPNDPALRGLPPQAMPGYNPVGIPYPSGMYSGPGAGRNPGLEELLKSHNQNPYLDPRGGR